MIKFSSNLTEVIESQDKLKKTVDPRMCHKLRYSSQNLILLAVKA